MKLVIDCHLGDEYSYSRYIKTFEYASKEDFFDDLELTFLDHQKLIEEQEKVVNELEKKWSALYRKHKTNNSDEFKALMREKNKESDKLHSLRINISVNNISIPMEACSFYKTCSVFKKGELQFFKPELYTLDEWFKENH